MKKKLGRPFVYLTIEDKKAAIRRNNAKTMRNPWHCEICDRTYTVGGKTMHLKTKKHSRNYYKDKRLIEL